ncbi:MAG: outer membrane lipoprotein-sorting protein [Calditrichaeota bacterium]|nr:outer membrane lipoprotein-sorting protein [Calditrichota bacterium]
MRGKSTRSIAAMTIVKPSWSRTVEMKSWSLGNEFFLIKILNPARDAGNVTLKREDEVWNYVRSIERIIKIPPSMMMQSWMGSDFTNDDLVKESSIVNDYTHELLGDTIIDNYQCHIIQLNPKESAAVVWGKIVSYIDKENYIPLRHLYYDEDGYLIKGMELSKIKKIGKRQVPLKMVMTPYDEPGNKTIIEYSELEFDIDIERSFFSQQNMKRVR